MRNRCVYCFDPIILEKGDAHEDCVCNGGPLDEDVREARGQVGHLLHDVLRGPLHDRLFTTILAELVSIRVVLGRGGRGDEGDVQETAGRGER